MAGLPFNPMSFVTPYTAVGTSRSGAGQSFANSINQGKAQKVSEGYLANAQRQQQQSEQRYGQKEMDSARERLDGALMSGNQDAVELAANNLRAIAGRYGFSLAETRSDAQLKSGVSTAVGKQEADPSAFTGLKPGEQADLSQDDFENQLIAGSGRGPSRYEEDGKTTAEFKGMLPQSADDEPVDMGDVDSPEFKAAAAAEVPRTPGGSLPQSVPPETTQLSPAQEKAFRAWTRQNGISDVDDPRAKYDYRGFWLETKGAPHRRGDHFPDTYKQHGHETFSEESRYSTGRGDGGTWRGDTFVPPIRTPGGSLPASPVAEPPGTSEAPLRGYTINGPDGKPIYSVAPKDILGRQQQRVGDVFSALASKTQDAQELQWLDQAKAETEKLVGIMPLDEAVKTGLAHYIGQMNSRDKLAMVEANHKPRGGGGGGGGLMGRNDDRAESTDKYGDNIEGALQHRGIPAAEQALSQAEGALLSGDPALQKDALKIILKARSGLTVSEAERRSYSMVDGALPALSNAISQWTGEPLDEQTVQSYLAIIRNMRRANEQTTQSIVNYERHKYEAQNRNKVREPVLRERSRSLDPNAVPAAPEPGKKSVKDLE